MKFHTNQSKHKNNLQTSCWKVRKQQNVLKCGLELHKKNPSMYQLNYIFCASTQ